MVKLLVLLATSVLVFGQACSQSRFDSKDAASGKSSDPTGTQGNGDSYGGKPTRYHLLNPNQSCAELGADGRPLPAKVIFTYPNRTAALVRENCADLNVPRAITQAELAFNSDASVVAYNGESYGRQPDANEFGVVAARCPAGMSPIAGATRVNLNASGQALTNNADWDNHVGIATRLSGSLAGLFRYEILRDDPANLDFWRRIHPAVEDLDGGRSYAYSFLAQPGTLNEAFFSVYRNGAGALSIVVNLSNGTWFQQENTGFGAFSVETRRISGGWFTTVYFTTPAGVTNTVIGIAPNGASPRVPAAGDSIHATAVQLEAIDSFCR
jgi:hypothetical protein